MKLINSVLAKCKWFASIAFIAALLSQLILPIVSAKANGPQFNFMDNDPKTLRGADRTLGDTVWNDSVTGNVGDEFRALVYVHNGKVDTMAHNTTIKVNLPTETSNGQFNVGATISADNASSVSDTLKVVLNGDGDVQFIPGTVAWYPNINGSATTQMPLPNGQSGNEIVSGGINIGDVEGCWDYISYVSFGFKVVSKATFDLQIQKMVRNISIGETGFVDANQANPGDVLEYQIAFRNVGKAVAPNASLYDVIPANTTYVAGTATILMDGGAVTALPDTLTTSGISLGDLASGLGGTVRFKVKTSPSLKNGQVLINTAYFSSSKITVSDTAQTTICVNAVPTVGTSLPVSGAGSVIISSLLTAMAGFGIWYYRKRKIAGTVVARVTKELLGK